MRNKRRITYKFFTNIVLVTILIFLYPLPHLCHYTQSQRRRKTVMAMANVWTVTQTAVVQSVTSIVNQVVMVM